MNYQLFYLLILSVFFSCSTVNQLHERRPSSDYESYLIRPDIFQQESTPHNLGRSWEEIKRAHIESIAMIIEMYPDRELYFLARDSELLYDQAKLLLKDEPDLLNRLHLLNVSRMNMKADHIEDYLEQEGLSTEELRKGKRFLLVDTGFSGTIPRVISNYYPEDLHHLIETQLLCSSNMSHPSSRAFLSWLNPEAATMNPGNMHGTIIGYEYIGRYTERSSHFEFREGKWVPVSDRFSSLDGTVSKSIAVQYMEDLGHFNKGEEARSLFQERRAIWKKLFKLGQEKDETPLINYLKELVDSNNPHLMAIVVDFFEVSNRNQIFEFPLGVTVKEIGLNVQNDNHVFGKESNKNKIMKKFPEWKTLLEEPETGIRQLLDSGNIEVLGKVVDILEDQEFFVLLGKELGKGNNSARRALIEVLIEKGGENLELLAKETFIQESVLKNKDLLEKLIIKAIETKDSNTFQKLAIYTFASQYINELEDLLELSIKAIIQTKDIYSLQNLIIYTFTNWHFRDFSKYFSQVLNTIKDLKDVDSLHVMAEFFSPNEIAFLGEALDLAFELKDGESIHKFSEFVFIHGKEEHKPFIEKALNYAIALEDKGALQGLAEFAFLSEINGQYHDLIDRLIDEARRLNDPYSLQLVTERILSRPYVKDVGNHIGKVLTYSKELHAEEVIAYMAEFVLSQEHGRKDPKLIEQAIDLAIEFNDKRSLQKIIQHVLREIDIEANRDIIRKALAGTMKFQDIDGIRLFAEDVFSRVDSHLLKAELDEVLDFAKIHSDKYTFKILATSAFSIEREDPMVSLKLKSLLGSVDLKDPSGVDFFKDHVLNSLEGSHFSELKMTLENFFIEEDWNHLKKIVELAIQMEGESCREGFSKIMNP